MRYVFNLFTVHHQFATVVLDEDAGQFSRAFHALAYTAAAGRIATAVGDLVAGLPSRGFQVEHAALVAHGRLHIVPLLELPQKFIAL